MPLLKRLLEKTKLNKDKGKDFFKPILFATESATVVKTFAFLATLLLVIGLLLSVNSVKNSRVLKSMASGSGIGSRIFCGSAKLCGDGKCEGEVWRECDDCPKGKAKAVMETVCGKYIKSECSLESVLCD